MAENDCDCTCGQCGDATLTPIARFAAAVMLGPWWSTAIERLGDELAEGILRAGGAG